MEKPQTERQVNQRRTLYLHRTEYATREATERGCRPSIVAECYLDLAQESNTLASTVRAIAAALPLFKTPTVEFDRSPKIYSLQ